MEGKKCSTGNAFYNEVAERKLIASGARHKKTGDIHNKCHMPVDDMTPSQIRRMSGPVKTYHLGKPMDWATFKDMPEDLQKKYIKNLYARFGVTNRRLALMFGCSHSTVDKKTAALGIHSKSTNGMTAEQKEAWAEFEVQR